MQVSGFSLLLDWTRIMPYSLPFLILVLLAIFFATGGNVHAQTPNAELPDETLVQLWADLLENEPKCTKAVLRLSKYPKATTRFLATKLPPLKLSGLELLDAVWRLGSDSEEEWRAAYQKLNYFDPRLAMGLEEILALDAAKEFPARNRLVDILSGRSIDAPYSATSQRYQSIVLHQFKDDDQDFFNFVGSEKPGEGGTSWWAEPKVEALNVGFSNPKIEWTRMIRAITLLESFDTPEAYAIVEAVASGHPDAQPTRVAQSILAARGKK
jgi:hypothetical protein